MTEKNEKSAVCPCLAGVCPKPERTYGETHYCELDDLHASDHKCRRCGMAFNADSVYTNEYIKRRRKTGEPVTSPANKGEMDAPSDRKPSHAEELLLAAIQKFRSTAGFHEGAHDCASVGCSQCELAYIRAEAELDAVLRPREGNDVPKLLMMKPNTYSAKLFEVPIPKGVFKIAGTLDGCVDLFYPGVGTYQLSGEEASQLAAALNGAVEDIRQNCLYDADALLDKEQP